MGAGRTSTPSFWRRTLALGLTDSDLQYTFNQAISPATSPCRIVIDPQHPTRREEILCDGAFDATVMRSLDIANRGLEGSVNGVPHEHDAGAEVWVTALGSHFDDLWDEVEAALSKAGGTMTGPVVFGDQLLSRAVLKDTGETVHDLGIVSGVVTIDYTNGPWQRFVANGAVTLAFSNWPASGTGGAVLLETKMNGFTLTYGAEVEHEGDVAPSISTTADKTDLHVFLTRTGGTKIFHPKPKLGFTP